MSNNFEFCSLVHLLVSHTVDGVVVEDDRVAVRGERHVELYAARAVPGAQPHRFEAVLGRVQPGGPAVVVQASLAWFGQTLP